MLSARLVGAYRRGLHAPLLLSLVTGTNVGRWQPVGGATGGGVCAATQSRASCSSSWMMNAACSRQNLVYGRYGAQIALFGAVVSRRGRCRASWCCWGASQLFWRGVAHISGRDSGLSAVPQSDLRLCPYSPSLGCLECGRGQGHRVRELCAPQLLSGYAPSASFDQALAGTCLPGWCSDLLSLRHMGSSAERATLAYSHRVQNPLQWDDRGRQRVVDR